MVNYTKLSMMRYLGRALKHDIFNHSGTMILPVGTILRTEHLIRLAEHGVYLTDADIAASIRKESTPLQLIDQTVYQIQSVFNEIRETNRIPISDVKQYIVPSIFHTAEHGDVFKIFALLQAKDDYTYRHNIGVGVIATMIGRWFNLNARDLSKLTMAATLHDVGKMKIPDHILTKPGRLTTEEYALIKNHTIFGYEILKATPGVSDEAALVALQHHERQDGTGYPYNLTGGAIDFFSRIVAVADVFHAMTSKRSYRDPSPFYQVLKEMHDKRFGVFDPKIISVFLEQMMSSLVGNRVRLTDQREGIIVYINPHDPIRPLVQIGTEFIDLSCVRTVHIEKVIT